MNRVSFALAIVAMGAGAQSLETVRVESKPLTRNVTLTAEFAPYQSVEVFARVSGFVERVLVDRGSNVKQGQLLAVLTAPEMDARVAEARSNAEASRAQVEEARSRAANARATYLRIQEAYGTPGAVSRQELESAMQSMEAEQSRLRAAEAAAQAAQAAVTAVERLRSYLRITAPFSGVVTERMAHPGALASPTSGALLRLEQVGRLRLVVAVPEAQYGAIRPGSRIPFRVAAYPGRTLYGRLARPSRSVDPKTRTMAVELDVPNADGRLAPGMYADVEWPAGTGASVLVVPATAIVTTTERVFVVRVRSGRAEWVDVRRGVREGDLVQVSGDLQAGDMVLRRGTDEVRDGAAVNR